MTETRPTLLVVDDVVTNIDILLETLGKDYTIRIATNGADALDSVKEARPEFDPPGCDDAVYGRL